MSREQTLLRRLRSQETLFEAVSAMKSLSAHHFRMARAALTAARDYKQDIDSALADCGFSQPAFGTAPPALLVVAADLGLCDGYNSRLAEAAVKRHAELDSRSTYCVGRRPVESLRRGGLTITKLYQSPTSAAGLTGKLMTIAQDVLGDYLLGKFARLDVVSARFKGVGEFTPSCARVLPVSPLRDSVPLRRVDYVSRRHLMAVALREFVYITLFQLLLDSLASEHGVRLVATESAGEWLKSRISETRSQLRAVHRETSTQELLDVVGGARLGRRYQRSESP